jgi:hypothetical protein
VGLELADGYRGGNSSVIVIMKVTVPMIFARRRQTKRRSADAPRLAITPRSSVL